MVTASERGKGIGNALLSKVVSYAKAKGLKRVSWEVLDWNTPAIDFYEAKGANVMRDWNVVQLDEKGIAGFNSI
jgi:ribosomal protein S18 acetylase RimI-like enzyme